MMESLNELLPTSVVNSYSEKESQSNDTLLHFIEFSNVHNSDRSSNALDQTSHIKCIKITLDPDSFPE